MERLGVFVALAGMCIISVIVARSEKPALVERRPTEKRPNDDVIRFARLVASYELARLHVKELEAKKEAKLVWGELFGELLAETELNASWTTRFIPKQRLVVRRVPANERATDAPKDQVKLSDFEGQAIKKIDEGAEEVLEAPSPENVLYVRAIRPLPSCVAFCHAPTGGPFPLFRNMEMGSDEIKGMTISLNIALAGKRGHH
jgi:hypothetical protein